MIVVNVRNVNAALKQGVAWFQTLEGWSDCKVSPRGMRTIEAPEPVATVYRHPAERVLFSPTRDANPFFHLFESLWMLAGRNDVEFLAKLNKRMGTYSDDGERLWGAYGWRWRKFFGYDQLQDVIELLHRDPDSRRAVVAMWSANGDLRSYHGGPEGGVTGKDIPCNTHLYFKVRGGRLNMTICNRSNDMIWGAYGANAVHMSMLQEYMAAKLGLPMGTMTQMSDSLHVYLDDAGGALWEKLKAADPKELMRDPYGHGVAPLRMDAETFKFDADLEVFFRSVDADLKVSERDYDTVYFKYVVVPLWNAFLSREVSDAEACAAPDWRLACREWLERRAK